MIIVTGGFGFIGSNLVHALNARGHNDILVVDDLTDGHKFKNLVDATIIDYKDKDDFLIELNEGFYDDLEIEAIFHQGACSTTTEWNGKYMMHENFDYSKALLHFALDKQIPFIYASSAATYGAETTFTEDPANEKPINVYGYSKILFDRYVRRYLDDAESQVVGLRYFNVYGPRESHKGSMASVAFHQNNQMREHGLVKLFGEYDGYQAGEQRRDFIYVDDVVDVNLWFMDHSEVSGIFNCGTGRSQPFNDIANSVIQWYGKGKIEYVAFPEHLKGHYQSFTEADLTRLRAAGYDKPFKTVQEGVKLYLDWLHKN